MQISSNLTLPLNSGRSPFANRQRSAIDSEQSRPQADTGRQTITTTDQSARRFRFVMPDNATTRSGQMALREYQMIQNEGGPELVNRIDVLV